VDSSDLREALERHREQLDELPGVVGSGIGLRGGQPDGEVVIRVFVDSSERVDTVREAAERLMEGLPVEVLATGTPEAYGTHGRP
jgi:hypothetical protein